MSELNAQEVFAESVEITSITLSQVLHPEHGEMILIVEKGDNDISPLDKLKIIEGAKLFIGADILRSRGVIE